jgi:DNA-binding CsgD family transcriptional regulator/tetratricopeptide (TPR) repeat protein
MAVSTAIQATPATHSHVLAPMASGGLSPEAQRLLRVAAVFGPTFVLSDVAGVLGEPVGRLLRSMQELLDARLIGANGESLTFPDANVQTNVYAAIPQPIRMALHRQIGALLLDQGGAAATAARHLMVGARRGDRRALAGLDRACKEVRACAPVAAADLAMRALELTELADEDRAGRALIAVECLIAARRIGEATRLARATLESGNLGTKAAAELRLIVSATLLMTGRPAEAVAVAESVLAESDLPSGLSSRAELARLLGLLVSEDFTGARLTAEAILGGDRLGGDELLGGALTALAFIAWDQGRVADTLGLLRAAVKRNDTAVPTAGRVYPRMGLAAVFTVLGCYKEAETAIAETREEIKEAGDTFWSPVPDILSSRLRMRQGKLAEAGEDANRGLAASEELETMIFVPMALSVLTDASLRRGEIGEAGRPDQSGSQPFSGRMVMGESTHCLIEAQVEEARGGAAEAMNSLSEVYDHLPMHRRVLVEEPAAAAWMVRVALASSDWDRAEAVVACAEQLAEENSEFLSIAASAGHARALLDQDPERLREAARCHVHPWASASASEDAGILFARRGDSQGAEALLQEALARYEEAGAEFDLARVRSRLRKLGVRRRHWCRSERPATGWGSLTETEERVASLVAEGLTNVKVAERMFLSRHTVDFHLRQVFRKLQVCSRVELTRLALER